MRYFLSVLLLLHPLIAQALPTLRLSAKLSASESSVSMSLISDPPTTDCQFEILGASAKDSSGLVASRSRLLLNFSSADSSTPLRARNLGARISSVRSRRSLFFRAHAICSDGTAISNIVRLRPHLANARASQRWLKLLGRRLALAPKLELLPAFPNLRFSAPVDFQSARDGSGRLFVVEQGGRILQFTNQANVASAQVFLDIRAQVSKGSEQGLLGLAFHPKFSQNGFFFVDYTDSEGNTVISRFKVKTDNPNLADLNSEQVVLQVAQPFPNHNGGQVAFGPDGFLYISFGDGGSGGDPFGNGQDLTSLLGKILRIDVDNPSGGKNYGIPSDNPFISGAGGARKEIFAYGFRNPWRFSFDRNNGDLWAGDVGQAAREEIDLVVNGGNYGWNTMEGSSCYQASNCNRTGLILPVIDYPHPVGEAVTGGYTFQGIYFYGDFATGRIWGLRRQGSQFINESFFDTDFNISAFGLDEQDNLYLLSYSDGKIYQIK